MRGVCSAGYRDICSHFYSSRSISLWFVCVCAVQLIQNQLYRAYFIVLTVSCGYANNMITHPKNAILASQYARYPLSRIQSDSLTLVHLPPDNAVVSLWLVICVVLTFSHWLCLSLFGQHVMKIIDWMEMHTKTNRNTTRRNMIRTPQRRKWMRDREKNTIKWCMFIYEIRVAHEMANWIEFEHSNARASPFDKQILMDFQFSTEILYRIVIIFIIAYGIL